MTTSERKTAAEPGATETANDSTVTAAPSAAIPASAMAAFAGGTGSQSSQGGAEQAPSSAIAAPSSTGATTGAAQGDEKAADAETNQGDTDAPQAPRPLESTAPTAPTTADVEVRKADVVSQITRHADLYRSPIGRGVRVQLQPEGMGLVDVTVRYIPTGGLELRMHAESAETGHLLESGSNSLRESLALQGLTAERVVVTFAANANNSNNNSQSFNGSSSDAAQGWSAQAQGNGNGRDAEGQRNTGPSDGGRVRTDESSEPIERQAPGLSRIDYRV